jgi:nucleoside-diphosphate-sugar epimerase
VRRTAADTRVARHALGWAPDTSLVDGLSNQLDWVRSRSLAAAGH